MFQKTIINKYLKTQGDITKKWKAFQLHFHNPSVQANIRNSKEEQYQEGFLRDLFVTIFDYKLNPDKDFTLTTELKNIKNSKKADGAIIINGQVKAVVELKGTNTTDLSKVENQAFGYKNNQDNCSYVIISNFEKLRFYIDNAIKNIEFNLFTLNEEEFKLLYLLLSFDSIKNDIPKKIINASISQEDIITKKLYKDYSDFKRELFDNLCKLNPQVDTLIIFKKSQKLLDRFLFLFFAEDSNLLPPNSVREVLKQWTQLKELDAYTPLYERFKKYFGYLNTGFKGKKYNIFAYNGGLFKPDEILDIVTIDDDILYNHTKTLSEYDFASEVDVNILGHIFENSLNELEEIQNKLQGITTEKTQTKRKKDGVFYTPKYITKYIVENTVGKICNSKKDELQIDENEYITDKRRQKKTVVNLLQKLKDYRSWLLELTICDPACGSGAFLNEALNFLIAEHKYLDELETKLLGGAITFTNIEKSILENNIFGVDINEESVEIAKLSLWLRTAQPNRKLNNLNENIKCGNSLIDDIEIAGEKAFNWQKEFPKIFDKGGFDVVIGNPPYVIMQPSNTAKKTLEFYKTFKVASYKIDLFHLFFEKSIHLLKEKGKLGFITPNTYLNNKYIKPLRLFILEKTYIDSIVNYKDQIFEDANVDVATIILTKVKLKNEKIENYEVNNALMKPLNLKKQTDWIDDKENRFNLNDSFEIKFIDCIELQEICSSYFGIQAFDRKSSVVQEKIDSNHLPIIDGGDIHEFSFAQPTKYFNFLSKNIKSGGNANIYNEKRIVISQIGFTPIVGLCKAGYLASNTLYNINLINSSYSLNYLLCILTSNLIKCFWKSKYSDGKKLFPKIKGFQLKELPIKIANKEQQKPFIDIAELMIEKNKKLQNISAKFKRTLKRKFTEKLDKLPKKIETWYTLTFDEFIKELKKKKIKLSLSEEAEWEDYFLTEQQKCMALQTQINKTDKEIDAMVYQLYGLTDDEIKIIEQ